MAPGQIRGVASFTQIRTCVLEKFVGFFLKIFCYWEKQFVVLRLDLVLCITKIATVWVVASEKFETFLKCLLSGDPTAIKLRIHEKRRDTGEIHGNTFVATKNSP